MKRIQLTSEKKADLERRHMQCHERKERDRIKAVLLRSEGWTVPMISQDRSLNRNTIIRHLRLRDAHGENGTIYFIVDQAPYHRAESVAREAAKLNIILKFLPAYSPNLNPIERLWKVMNEKVRNNRFFKSAKDFKQT